MIVARTFEIRNIGRSSIAFGYAVGIDLTRRDRRWRRELGRPWTGARLPTIRRSRRIQPVAKVGHGEGAHLAFRERNGSYDADIADLIRACRRLSRSVALHPAGGDVIMTGTPAGVGAIVPATRRKAASMASARSRSRSRRASSIPHYSSQAPVSGATFGRRTCGICRAGRWRSPSCPENGARRRSREDRFPVDLRVPSASSARNCSTASTSRWNRTARRSAASGRGHHRRRPG